MLMICDMRMQVDTGSVRAEKLGASRNTVLEWSPRIFGESAFLLGTPRTSGEVPHSFMRCVALRVVHIDLTLLCGGVHAAIHACG
jgi:hypothetical protein